MKCLSLFDTGEETASESPLARLKAEPWLVEELIRLGVTSDKAAGFSMRQAFAVRAKLQKGDAGTVAKPKLAKVSARELSAPLAEPVALPARAGNLVRQVGADELDAILAQFAKGEATEDELYRFVRGSLYLFDAAELVRVAKGFITVLRTEAMNAKCRSCGAPIFWVKTESGKAMPLDAQPVVTGNIVVTDGVAKYLTGAEQNASPPELQRYVSHFATCVHAAKHRKPKTTADHEHGGEG